MPKRTLILLRHAKSDWRAGAADDHERPLNARGQRAAALIGVYLSQQGLAPDLVVTSSAARARETTQRVLHHGGFALEPKVERRLYMADPTRILDVIREQNAATRCMLVVGHNPGMEGLVTALSRDADAGLRDAAGEFVTAAMAVGALDGDWSGAGPETIALIEITAPKALV
jgi:phosphohistidine phosphatase